MCEPVCANDNTITDPRLLSFNIVCPLDVSMFLRTVPDCTKIKEWPELAAHIISWLSIAGAQNALNLWRGLFGNNQVRYTLQWPTTLDVLQYDISNMIQLTLNRSRPYYAGIGTCRVIWLTYPTFSASVESILLLQDCILTSKDTFLEPFALQVLSAMHHFS